MQDALLTIRHPTALTLLVLLGLPFTGGCPAEGQAWKETPASHLRREPGAEALRRAGPDRPSEALDMYARAYVPGVSGQICTVPEPGMFLGSREVAYSHGTTWSYDTHTPFLIYGPGVVRPTTQRGVVRPYDLTATLADALRIPPPPAAVGRPQSQILQPERRYGRGEPLRAVVLIMLDQVGYDDLAGRLPDLPTFRRFRSNGAWFTNCHLDYAPSSTAVSHATVGTGTLPGRHGVSSNRSPRSADELWTGSLGVTMRDGRGGIDPSRLLVPTLADWLDLMHRNRSIIISHITAEYAATALAGHGAWYSRGDRDIVVWYDRRRGRHSTDRRYYRIPSYIANRRASRLLDAGGVPFHGSKIRNRDHLRATKEFARFEAENILRMIQEEGVGADEVPDLVMLNLKTTDYVGHWFGHGHPAYLEALREIDRFLRLSEALIRRTAGPGRYLFAITADHGLCPDDGVRVDRDDLERRLNSELDAAGDRDGVGPVIGVEASHIYIDRGELAQDGVTLDDVRERVLAEPWCRHAWTEEEVKERARELRAGR